MNIIFVINGLRYGGMERQLVETIKAVSEKGHSTYLAVLNHKGPMSAVVEKYLSQPIFYLDRRKIRIFGTMVHLARIARRIEADLIHTQDSFSAFYAMPVSKLLRIKIINGSIRHAGVTSGCEYWYDKLLLLLSDAIISNSKAGLQFYGVKGYVLYNFVDRSRFRRSEAPLSKIVMNANFTNYKDHLTLLSAGKKLIQGGIIDQIGLIGDGPHRCFYEKLCGTMGISDQVVFYGHIDNIEDVLQDYGIGVMCSTKKYKEGISNSILEYMGSGLIAIGTNVGAIPEILIDGYNGYIFEVEDSISLYQKICNVIKHESEMENIRSRAYETLDIRFNQLTNCKSITKIYERVLLGSR